MVFTKNPLIPKKDNSKIKAVDLPHSAGILDDFAVRKNIATKEGTIEKVPVNNSDIVNKSYADGLVSNSAQWDTAYTHSQDNSQAHSDYMLNTGDTATGDYNFSGNINLGTNGIIKVGSGTAKIGALDTEINSRLCIDCGGQSMEWRNCTEWYFTSGDAEIEMWSPFARMFTVNNGASGGTVYLRIKNATGANMIFTPGTITDSSGSISFSDENLLTTGTFGASDINATGVYKVDGTQVVTNQQAHIEDADGTLADATTKINAILAMLETHGLVASS